jgi:hypothetical protein
VVRERGESEELVIDPDETEADPRAQDNSGRRGYRGNGESPFDVVPPDGAVRITECLQRGDLRPLQRERASERHVQHERRDSEEDARDQQSECLQLRQLVVERPCGHLQRSRRGTSASIRLEHTIDCVDHVRL